MPMELISTPYFLPPVSWFAKAAHADGIILDQHSHFRKQTLRNRCYIDSPNGRLALTLPIDRTGFSADGKCCMKDVRLSNHFDWRRQHWQALETSYHNSPFFDYLQDDFRNIYNKEWTYLIDLNEALISQCLDLLELNPTLSRTEEFIAYNEEKTGLMQPKAYYQVFRDRHDFLEDLSVIDLIFNMGPEAPLFLI